MAIRKFEITAITIGTTTTKTVELDTSNFANEQEVDYYLWELVKREKNELVDGSFQEIFEDLGGSPKTYKIKG